MTQFDFAQTAESISPAPNTYAALLKDDLTGYKRWLNNNHPPLTAQQEQELAKRAELGDPEAKQHLVMANLRLVLSVARRYGHREGTSLHDLIQDGIVGLLRACEKYDWRKGFRFSTYACWWIQQAVLQSFAEHDRIIRLPANVITQVSKLKKAQDQILATTGRQATAEELSKQLELPLKKIHQLLQMSQKAGSLEALSGSNQDDEDGQPLMEFISVSTPAADECVAAQQRQRALLTSLGQLNGREKDVIMKRYLLELHPDNLEAPKWTLEKLAAQYGVTRESIRQSEKRALGKLKQYLLLQEVEV